MLRGTDFVVKAGSVTALVGGSGEGKSTVLKLMARLYEPASGSVHLDGADLRTLQPRWLRQDVVAFVTQEPVMIAGKTVRENIAFGCRAAAAAAIERAARGANAHDFIAGLPDGYASRLGDEGVGLSVGQRQRLALARALLKESLVLLLDEPTSAQDTTSEARLQATLRKQAAQGRTILIVAHRLSTVKAADSIAVLRNGRIVEQGTHDELIALDREYARMLRDRPM